MSLELQPKLLRAIEHFIQKVANETKMIN
jgi:hypothetical protein